MKVRDLLEKLKNVDPNLEVFGYSEDEELLASGHQFRVLDLVDIAISDAERARTDDGVPTFKFGRTANSRSHVIVEMTGSF